jgi:mannose-6-phosphate isomerase
MGFKKGATRLSFADAVKRQDVSAMEGMLHRFEVKPGDAFFIPGRFPHAIGPGVFMLEVQEPTDWVVQPERFIGDTELSFKDMWGPLDVETGLDCFDYSSCGSAEEILCRVSLTSCMVRDNSCRVESLVGRETTDCFSVRRMTFTSSERCTPTLDSPWHIGIVTEGAGALVTDNGATFGLRPGMTYFWPASAGVPGWRTGSRLVVFAIR